MRQGQGSQRVDRPRRVDMSSRKGAGVGALLMGIVGFGLGLFFGWLLHRERVGHADYGGVTHDSDRATTTLADTSARLELADQDVVDLRTQLTDAQHLLDERAATIAQLESELAVYRDDPYDENATERADIDDVGAVAVTDEFVDAAADAATAPDTPAVDHFDVDETDVTDEVLVPTDDVVVQEEDATPVEEPGTDEHPVEDVRPDFVDVPPDGVLVDETAAATPAAAPPVAVPSDDVAGEGPFVPPPDAEPDNLRRIRGIGPAMERLLNEQGIVTFRQLAVLNDAGIEELQGRLPGVPGRIRRDQWVPQARDLHVETHGDQP